MDYFAVARVYELEKLRDCGVFNKVTILSPVLDEKNIALAIKLKGELTVDNTLELMRINRIAKSLNKIANIHIKVDSGMNRFGVKSIREFEDIINLAHKLFNVSIVGIYSHFACSDNPNVVKEQNDKFSLFVSWCRKKQIYPIVSISSSKLCENLTYAYDMVRVGINLYELDDSICFSGQIIEIKNLKKGESLGYDYSFTAKEDMTMAIVDIGYGDICIRKLSNKGKMILNGRYYNIIGNVCMDCLFLDVTGADAKIGDKAILFGKDKDYSISVCEVAKVCDTISYELFSSITERVKRIYK